MKKIKIYLILIFAGLTWVFVGPVNAEKNDAYSFYPSEVYKPRGEMFKKSKQLIAVAPLRPLVVRDKNGNVMYTTSRGEVMVKVDTKGNMTFSIKGRRDHTTDSDGKVTKRWEREGGSSKVVVKNEFDEKIKIEEYGLGGKMVSEYDESGNLTKSYEYNKFGKKMEWLVDELTLSRTKYDDYGNALYDMDFEGYKVAEYEYDGDGYLQSKSDQYGNKTYFDKTGNMTKTVASEGYRMATYNYKTDEKGYSHLISVKDDVKGNVTFYKDDKQQEVKNHNGVVITKYKWLGTKLIYTENFADGNVTWYKNARRTYTTREGVMEKEWMYFEGKLMGLWDDAKNTFLFYTHGREALSADFEEKPTLKKLVDLCKENGLEF